MINLLSKLPLSRWPLRMALVGLLALLPARGSAVAAELTRFPIEIEEVTAALAAAHLSTATADVRLLVHLTATAQELKLEVSAIEPWGTHGAHVRLVCKAREQCLPFYVTVQWSDGAVARQSMLTAGVAEASINRADAQSGPERDLANTPENGSAHAPTAFIPTSEGALPLHPGYTPSPAPAAIRHADTVRAGGRALLEMDGERLHIELPVICLENGEAGRTIRVTGLDHRQTYEALVVNSGSLKGRL